MKQRAIILMKIFLLGLVFISCKEESKKNSNTSKLANISIDKWNSNTMENVNRYCNLDDFEYTSNMPVVLNTNRDTLDIKGHFLSKINYRNQLIKELSNDYFLNQVKDLNEVTIIESYRNKNFKGEQIPSYEVYFDKDKLLFHLNYDVNSNSYKIKLKTWENPNENKLIESSKCVNKLLANNTLGYISIKTKLIFNDNIQYITEYVYIGDGNG